MLSKYHSQANTQNMKEIEWLNAMKNYDSFWVYLTTIIK